MADGATGATGARVRYHVALEVNKCEAALVTIPHQAMVVYPVMTTRVKHVIVTRLRRHLVAPGVRGVPVPQDFD